MGDITAITALHVSSSEVVVPNATSVSATVGEETHDDGHMVEVSPLSLVMTSQVVTRDPPPLAISLRDFRRTANCPHHWHQTLWKRWTAWKSFPDPMDTRCQCHHPVLYLWQRTERIATRAELCTRRNPS